MNHIAVALKLNDLIVVGSMSRQAIHTEYTQKDANSTKLITKIF